MEFKQHEIHSNSTQIHILDYQDYNPIDYISNLTDIEKERFFSFNNIKRQQEFVATRLLRHNLFGLQHIHYDPLGAPFIPNEGFISISHSKNKVAVAVNKDYKVGLDLESHRKNILELKSKFLSKHEVLAFNCDDYIQVTKIWSAKEALYKLAGRKKIHFSEELLLSIDEKNNWNGRIINPKHELLVKLDIFDIDGTIISINKEKVEQKGRRI